MTRRSSNFEKILVQRGLLSADALEQALQLKARQGGSLAVNLVIAGAIDDLSLAAFYEERYQVRRIREEELARVGREVFGLIPVEIIYDAGLFPLALEGESKDRLLVGIIDPSEPDVLEEATFFAELTLIPCLMTIGQMARHYRRLTSKRWKVDWDTVQARRRIRDAREQARELNELSPLPIALAPPVVQMLEQTQSLDASLNSLFSEDPSGDEELHIQLVSIDEGDTREEETIELTRPRGASRTSSRRPSRTSFPAKKVRAPEKPLPSVIVDTNVLSVDKIDEHLEALLEENTVHGSPREVVDESAWPEDPISAAEVSAAEEAEEVEVLSAADRVTVKLPTLDLPLEASQEALSEAPISLDQPKPDPLAPHRELGKSRSKIPRKRKKSKQGTSPLSTDEPSMEWVDTGAGDVMSLEETISLREDMRKANAPSSAASGDSSADSSGDSAADSEDDNEPIALTKIVEPAPAKPLEQEVRVPPLEAPPSLVEEESPSQDIGLVFQLDPDDASGPLPAPLMVDLQALEGTVDRDEVGKIAARFLRHFYKRIVLLTVRGQQASVWVRAVGAEPVTPTEPERFAIDEFLCFRRVLKEQSSYLGPVLRGGEGPETREQMVRMLGGEPPMSAVLCPIFLNKRMVAMFYCDEGPREAVALDRVSLSVLCQNLEQALRRIILWRKRQQIKSHSLSDPASVTPSLDQPSRKK